MKLKLKDVVILSLIAALMTVSDFAMEFLPNVHLVGVFIVVTTLVYRQHTLLPIYVYVLMQGVISGFGPWWIAYLYIWTVLWGATMLLPKNMPKAVASVVYPIVCALHGLFFGVLYAPVQALMFGFTFEQTLAWIAAGFTFDIIHTIGNFAVGLLIYPASEALKRLTKDI